MNFGDNKPIFKQIADYIIDNILSDEWSAGQRIMSVRELASEIEVNPNTVARTFSLLSDMGVIYNQRGIGYFITKDARQICTKKRQEEFIKSELPELFRKMDLLNIDIDQIKKLYHDKKNEK